MEDLSQRETEFISHRDRLRQIVSEPNSYKAQQLYSIIRYNLICYDTHFPEIQVGLLYFCGLDQTAFEQLDLNSINLIFSLISSSLVSILMKEQTLEMLVHD